MSHNYESLIQPVLLRPEKQRNATCRRMIFQGTPTTKIFQAKEIDKILNIEPDYKFWNGFENSKSLCDWLMTT